MAPSGRPSDTKPSDQVAQHVQLLLLTWMSVQNALHTIFMRYSRSRKVPDMFLPSTAVFWSELIKIVICVTIVLWEEASVARGILAIRKTVVENPIDTLKVCIPSFVYTLSNNLNFVAATYLDAATFAITAQLKLLTTAVFSVLILGKPLSRTQWLSLLVLFAGVSLVQMPSSPSSKGPKAPLPKLNTTVIDGSESFLPVAVASTSMFGFLAAFMASVLAGFAGVYFEKILKSRTTSEGPVSVWMRNVQLAVSSVPIALISTYVADGPVVREKGLLYGFDGIVWLTVSWFSIGGLSVAVCIKYTDNIRKNFATSVAIILSTVLSIYIFNFKPTMYFVSGAAIVIGALFMYAKAPPAGVNSQKVTNYVAGGNEGKLRGDNNDNSPLIRVG